MDGRKIMFLFTGSISDLLPLLFLWLFTTCQGREYSVQHSYSVNYLSIMYSLLHQLMKLNTASPLHISSLKIWL